MQTPYKLIREAAADLRTGERSLRDWLKKNPRDAQGVPFYGGFGRNKLFTVDDIERIRLAYPCPSTSPGRKPVARHTTKSAAAASASQLAEVLELIERGKRRGSRGAGKPGSRQPHD
jgi:hypothetical protein